MEGNVCKGATAILSPLHVSDKKSGSIHFFVGDACNMMSSQQLGTFDAILCSNLLCRLSDPMSLLDSLSNYLNVGGVVLFVSPYSWLEEYTPKENWIGGYTTPCGIAINSKQKLKEIMEERGFVNIHDEAVSLLIREHERKFQYIISDATGWRRVK